MLASHAWLMELTGLSLDTSSVAERFTAAGLEVEGVHSYGEGLTGVVIAEVRSARPHPKRDKLRLVTVFDGSRDQEVVCGAPNVPNAGRRVVLARLGARLPDGLEIAPRELFGVVSEGMLCSERELDASAESDGIIVLPEATLAQPGELAADALRLRDTTYELSLTPNRPDCLGHVGLARELCAIMGARFVPPTPRAVAISIAAPHALFPQRDAVFCLSSASSSASGDLGFAPVRVDIADATRCPRYGAALVTGVTVGPSPLWLRHRLHRLGLRSINNLVDATNYILLLFGHPIHGFDYRRVRGSRIAVRLAREGEHMRTLDGVERELCGDDLLICDAEGPIALAGVMGGENSQIEPDTRQVLIECAYFDPRSVRRTSKRTGMHTDSSHRFERGVDPSAVRDVLAHASALIAELGGGAVVSDALDVIGTPIGRTRIALRLARIDALLGHAVARERTGQILRRLGCALHDTSAGFDVDVPTHRPDLLREVDLIEEVARLVGYEAAPTVLPKIPPSHEGTPAAIGFVRKLREAAASAGLLESINYAFVSALDLKRTRSPEVAMRVVNPLSEERSVMRTSLLPGLSTNLRHAQHQQLKTFAQFELARVFNPRPRELLPEEQLQLGLLLWGERRSWYTEGETFDLYDAKGMVEALVRGACGRAIETHLDTSLEREARELHPRRSARIYVAERAIGVIGELHPDLVTELGLVGRPIFARIDVADLSRVHAELGLPQAQALPRFPPATRDLAVVVPEGAVAGEVAAALQSVGGAHAEAVVLFDVYRGEPVPAGSKSLAFHVVYRDPESTLTDKVVDALHAKVLAAAEQRFGASLRR